MEPSVKCEIENFCLFRKAFSDSLIQVSFEKEFSFFSFCLYLASLTAPKSCPLFVTTAITSTRLWGQSVATTSLPVWCDYMSTTRVFQSLKLKLTYLTYRHCNFARLRDFKSKNYAPFLLS